MTLAAKSTGTAIFHTTAGMGKSGMAMNMAMQAALQGSAVFYFSLEDTHFKVAKERQPSLPHDPTHTPLQCLAEGVRRVMQKTDRQREKGLLFVAHVMNELGIECQAYQTIAYTSKPRIQERKPQPRWQQSTVKKTEHLLILKTSLGYVDSHGRSGQTLETVIGPNQGGRRGHYSLLPIDQEDILRETEHLISPSVMGWWRRPYLLAEAREELELAWMQGQTGKTEHHTSRRL